MTTRNEIGSRIEELRNQKGVTQQEVANALFVDRVTVSQWEKGTRDIKTGNMVSVAEYFGVSCDYLLGRSRAATPDDFMQEIVTRYGLTEATLQFLERLNASLDIDNVEQGRIIAKQIEVDNWTPTFLEKPPAGITDEELQILVTIEQDEINKQALSTLNEILTTTTGREWETYGLQILTTIYNYCHREYANVEKVRHGIAGRTMYTLTADIQRNIELYGLNDILSHLRGKIAQEGGNNGKHT
jgi:transcriptional regulator with XRE-family HTH domain